MWWAVPAVPALGDALARFAPTVSAPPVLHAGNVGKLDFSDRLGMWLMRRVPHVDWAKSLSQELAVAGMPAYRFYGGKLVVCAVTFLGTPLAVSIVALVLRLPIQVPMLVTVAATVGVWWWPNVSLRSTAARRRLEFRYALSSYIDLVAVERLAGSSGARQALENATKVGDSWAFQELSELFTKASLQGVTAWDGLVDMAGRFGIPELEDVATQMRLADTQSASIYEPLRSLSSMLRATLLAAEQGRAKQASQSMILPTFLMAFTIILLMLAPLALMLLDQPLPIP
jgi:Flp pilus assembly protein TadB